MIFKAKLSFNSFKNSLGQPDLKKLIEAPNNKFIKAINSQVCLKIQSFTNNPLELNEKENLDAKETEENNESDDE